MDLYSAAKRLNRPFRFTEDFPDGELPIGARGGTPARVPCRRCTHRLRFRSARARGRP